MLGTTVVVINVVGTVDVILSLEESKARDVEVGIGVELVIVYVENTTDVKGTRVELDEIGLDDVISESVKN